MSSKYQPQDNDILHLRDAAVSFDVDAFDDLIHAQGVTFCHERAIPCPLGQVDPDDTRHPFETHPSCTNGFLYLPAGKITCGFTGNTKNHLFNDVGIADGSTASIVIPRFYDQDAPGPKVPTDIMKFDRLYLDQTIETTITVPAIEKLTVTKTGIDRAEFPVVKVIDLVDAQGKSYKQDVDFKVVSGNIVWGANRPSFDATRDRGEVYSLRYTYRPFWLIDTILHEVRVAPVTDEYTGLRSMQRMPKGAIIKREFLYRKKMIDPFKPDPRDHREPAGAQYPSFGPSDYFGPRT